MLRHAKSGLQWPSRCVKYIDYYSNAKSLFIGMLPVLQKKTSNKRNKSAQHNWSNYTYNFEKTKPGKANVPITWNYQAKHSKHYNFSKQTCCPGPFKFFSSRIYASANTQNTPYTSKQSNNPLFCFQNQWQCNSEVYYSHFERLKMWVTTLKGKMSIKKCWQIMLMLYPPLPPPPTPMCTLDLVRSGQVCMSQPITGQNAHFLL